MDEPIVATAIRREDDPAVVFGKTAAHLPDTVTHLLTPIRFVTIRTLRVYLQSLLGMLTVAGMMPEAIGDVGATDFTHRLLHSASLAVAPAAVTFLQNLLEVISRADQKAPTWTA